MSQSDEEDCIVKSLEINNIEVLIGNYFHLRFKSFIENRFPWLQYKYGTSWFNSDFINLLLMKINMIDGWKIVSIELNLLGQSYSFGIQRDIKKVTKNITTSILLNNLTMTKTVKTSWLLNELIMSNMAVLDVSGVYKNQAKFHYFVELNDYSYLRFNDNVNGDNYSYIYLHMDYLHQLDSLFSVYDIIDKEWLKSFFISHISKLFIPYVVDKLSSYDIGFSKSNNRCQFAINRSMSDRSDTSEVEDRKVNDGAITFKFEDTEVIYNLNGSNVSEDNTYSVNLLKSMIGTNESEDSTELCHLIGSGLFNYYIECRKNQIETALADTL